MTDTALTPALIGEFDHLEAGVVTLRMAVIGPKRSLALHGNRAVLPELFHRLVVNLVVQLVKEMSLSRLWYTGPPMKGGPQMASVRFADLQSRPVEFLDFTR